jgi:hypothetical protein
LAFAFGPFFVLAPFATLGLPGFADFSCFGISCLSPQNAVRKSIRTARDRLMPEQSGGGENGHFPGHGSGKGSGPTHSNSLLYGKRKHRAKYLIHARCNKGTTSVGPQMGEGSTVGFSPCIRHGRAIGKEDMKRLAGAKALII